MKVVKINDEQFEEAVINSKSPVMVKFYADWCSHCEGAGKIFEELANECEDIKFYSMDVDESADTAMEYGIMSIPTAVLFDGGEEKKRFIGFKDKDSLSAMLMSL